MTTRPPSTISGRNPVDEDKMAEMVGAELQLETVGSPPERGGHDSCAIDDDVEGFCDLDDPIGTLADACERREIQLDHIGKTAGRLSGVPHACCRRLGLAEISRGADHLRAMSGKRTARLHAESDRHSGDEYPLIRQTLAANMLSPGPETCSPSGRHAGSRPFGREIRRRPTSR